MAAILVVQDALKDALWKKKKSKRNIVAQKSALAEDAENKMLSRVSFTLAFLFGMRRSIVKIAFGGKIAIIKSINVISRMARLSLRPPPSPHMYFHISPVIS